MQGEEKGLKINVQVVFFEEDNIRFAYIPSFDLMGYGNTLREANESLKVVLDECILYTSDKNTFAFEMKQILSNLNMDRDEFVEILNC